MFRNFNDIQSYLDTLGMFRMKAGQERISKALDDLNLLPLPYKAVQIVGTNGKGSTSTFLSTIAIEHTLNTGLFTSPHFISVKERILVNNRKVNDAVWISSANTVYAVNKELTYFEFVTLLAVLIYKACNCDIVFFEAGLGGKFDATTALFADACVFSPIALDHCHILGSTIEEIAEDKAQAMHAKTKFALSARQDPRAAEKLNTEAKKHAIPLYYTDILDKDIALRMQGQHQYTNAGLAKQAWHSIATELLAINSDERKVRKALENAFIAGRLQIIPKEKSPLEDCEIILDGGHNIHGLQAINTFFENLRQQAFENYIIFSCLADKEPLEMIKIIEKIAQNMHAQEKINLLIPTISNNPRAEEAQKLAQLFENSPYLIPKAYKNLDECLKNLHNRKNTHNARLLICGSLYMLAEFYELYPQFLEK